MFKSKRRTLVVVAALALSAAMIWAALDLSAVVQVVYDEHGVPTIRARTEADAIYMLGYLHARDRFFQMDVQRRLFSGTLAELFGPSVLPQDVQLRTLGLRRAAERSLPVQTPEVTEWLESYSAGVNAFLDNAMFGNMEDACSDGGDSSDDSVDGDSVASSDDSSNISGDSAGKSQIINALPPEYAVLEIDRDGIPDWTPLDSLTMAKGLAFSLSFELGDIDRTIALLTFLNVGDILGFNGLQLYGADLYVTAPFDSSVTIPPTAAGAPPIAPSSLMSHYLENPNLVEQLQEFRDEAAECPLLEDALQKDFTEQGSNWFLVAGSKSASGNTMLANDPHLALGTPATFYEAHIQVKNGINVTGVTFPGAPGIVQGCTDVICWGSSVNPLDVTDVYQEVLLALGPDPTQPTHTVFGGVPEPIQFIPQQFFFNNIGDGGNNTLFDAMIPPSSGGVTLVVPRRNNGPIVNIDASNPALITALSVQYTGWSATQELEAFRQFARAQTPEDFKDALQFFDVGSQNWAYADINGNIAYYTSAELPIREDLQTLFFPDGLQPPYFIRDGTHTLKHEWLPIQNPQPNQAIAWEILPFDEMPQLVNPPEGVILNANNDPIGTTLDNVSWNEFRAGFNGRLYLNHSYAPGFRMGRIKKLFDAALAGGGKVSAAQLEQFQANNQLLDAEFFTPFLLTAFDNAAKPEAAANLAALAADPEIAEAIDRLALWDFSTPTGLVQGFDPGDPVGAGNAPSQAEIDASVAATIYSVWRGQLVQRVIDQTLASLPVPLDSLAPPGTQSIIAVQRLLQAYPIRGGVGLSLINFFNEPDGANAADRRDLILLRALRNSLDLLASDDFAPAFGNSMIQDDYRWGKLHRLVLAHPLGSVFNIPPAGSPANVAPDLPGFARAGGLGAVDASAHGVRADGLNEFMFDSGPARRVVAVMKSTGPHVIEVIPGGESGIPGNPRQTDQLNLWLVNDYHSLPVSIGEVYDSAGSCQNFMPTPPQP